jgi:hypothetical protein
MWKYAFFLGLFLIAVWGLPQIIKVDVVRINNPMWLLGAAVVSFALAIFALLARFVAYVQICSDHINLVTPFLRTKISFRRIRNSHPVLLQQLFPAEKANWSQRSYLEPFYGKTVVEVELRGFPLSPVLLRLFLPAQMFSPKVEGLVFLVQDWMKFSTELDTFQGNWMQSQKVGRPKAAPGKAR